MESLLTEYTLTQDNLLDMINESLKRKFGDHISADQVVIVDNDREEVLTSNFELTAQVRVNEITV